MKTLVPLLLLCLFTTTLFAQRTDERARLRQEKLETILRIKDRRTVHDGKLIQFLGDQDPFIREHAALAYASIQDTAALPLLLPLLADRQLAVEEAAAFAIGQTAVVLSPQGQARLENEIIWKRLPDTRATDRMLEELGKFGTREGLSDLLIRIGNVFPQTHVRAMTLALARFAIRGIQTTDAQRYLLRQIQSTDAASWEAVYALQRIGDTPEIRAELERIVLLRNHTDPLVRMQLAILLGKVQDERIALDPLRRLAEFDTDWRVRVQALKALALYQMRSDPSTLQLFRRAFYDASTPVALSAVAALRSSGLVAADSAGPASDVFSHLRLLALNRGGNMPWPLQAEAVQTYALLLGPSALPDVAPGSWPQRFLQADALRAAGTTGSRQAAPLLLEASHDTDPVKACGALDGLLSLCRRLPQDTLLWKNARAALYDALASRDVAISGTAATLLADSLVRDENTGTRLLQALSTRRLPDDLEAMQEIIAALGSLGETRAILPLMEFLQQPPRTIAAASADALTRITGTDYRAQVPTGFEPLYTDFDFAYLRALPDTVHISIETVRGTINADLYADAAPFTVMAILKLASQRGFYRGLTFHRVVPTFVVQGGCPRGDGWGGPGFTLRSEFSDHRFGTGTIGIASSGKDTEGSQIFITQSPQPHLDGRYTVIGTVTGGMSVVDALQRNDRIYDLTVDR